MDKEDKQEGDKREENPFYLPRPPITNPFTSSLPTNNNNKEESNKDKDSKVCIHVYLYVYLYVCINVFVFAKTCR